MRDSVRFEKENNRLTAFLCGELDHHTAGMLRLQIDHMISLQRPKELILDFSAVPFMDSSGIGLILGRHRKMTEIGGSVFLQQMSPRIAQMVALSGIEKTIGQKEET